MEPYPETHQSEYESCCVKANTNHNPTGLFGADEPQRTSSAHDFVPASVRKCNEEVTDVEKNLEAEGTIDASSGYSDNLLAELESGDGPFKAVQGLEEALWLVQEELAEEQRLRAEERKHYAVFQDEYLRLQEENAINSKRITAAEVAAQAARSLAIDAVEDKEYFMRLLYQTQRQLHCLTALVEDAMPRFKTKLSHLIEQGNTVVALLARRWPEARLRKQIEALGIADQPLARWALFHALKEKEIPCSRSTTQRSSDACTSCPPSSRELRQAENLLDSTVTRPQVQAREANSALCCVEEKAETSERIQRNSDQVHSLKEKGGGVCASKPRVGAVSDATCRLPLHFRCQTEALPSARMAFLNSSAIDKRRDSQGHVEGASIHKDGSKLVSRPSSVATRSRVQTVADRKIKQPDPALQSIPSGARHHLPPLPVGRLVLPGTVGTAPRDSHRTHRIQAAFTKNGARGGETSVCRKEISAPAPLASSRRYISRQTKQCKEDHGSKLCEAQDCTVKPVSNSSNSRRSVTQKKISLNDDGVSVSLHTSGNLRATQPPSVAESLPNSGIPSRMTCGAVLPMCKELIKRQSVAASVNKTKEKKRGTRLFQELTPHASTGTNVTSQIQSAADIPHGRQSQQTTSVPLPPVLYQPLLATDEDLGRVSDNCASIVRPLAAVGKNESLEGVSDNARNPKRADATAPADPQTLRSSGTRAVSNTTQGSSGCKPNGNIDEAEAAVAARDHSIETGHKPALPSRDVATPSQKITPHLQEANKENHQAEAIPALSSQSEANRLCSGMAVPAKLIQPQQHKQIHQPQLASLAAPGIQGHVLLLSRQQKDDAVKDVRNAQHFVPCGVARGTLPAHPQQFQLHAPQQTERQWPHRIPYEVPRRSSLPESGAKGIQSYANNMFVQHQQLIVGRESRGGLPWPTRTMGQPPVFASSYPCSYTFQQPASFKQQQLPIPQQYSQPYRFQQAVTNQQQAAVANVHYVVRNVRPDFIATQQQHTGIPMPGGWLNR